MEERIKEIINSLDKFEIVDFSQEDVNLPTADVYYVQLREQESNLQISENNFHKRADFLITYNYNQIDIYTRITNNIPEDDTNELRKILNKNLPGICITHTPLAWGLWH